MTFIKLYFKITIYCCFYLGFLLSHRLYMQQIFYLITVPIIATGKHQRPLQVKFIKPKCQTKTHADKNSVITFRPKYEKLHCFFFTPEQKPSSNYFTNSKAKSCEILDYSRVLVFNQMFWLFWYLQTFGKYMLLNLKGSHLRCFSQDLEEEKRNNFVTVFSHGVNTGPTRTTP